MAITSLLSAEVTYNVPTSTNYLPIGVSRLSSNSTESSNQAYFRTAGTLSNLYCRIIANDRTGAGTIKVRKNTADGNQSISITAGTTGDFEDTTHTDSVSAGDRFNYSIISGTGGSTCTYSNLGCLFSATSNTVTKYIAIRRGNNSSTVYYAITGSANNLTTPEAQRSVYMRCAGTFKNLHVCVNANTRDVASTYGLYKNSGIGNLVVSYAALESGDKEDTSHTDSVVATDQVQYYFSTTTGTGNVAMQYHSVEFETTTAETIYVTHDRDVTVNANTTVYEVIQGMNNPTSSTENDIKSKARYSFTASYLGVQVMANSVTAESTLTLRKNNGNGNLSVSIPASTNGRFWDTTHTDSIIATDSICYQLVAGSTGTSLKLYEIVLLATAAAKVPIFIDHYRRRR